MTDKMGQPISRYIIYYTYEATVHCGDTLPDLDTIRNSGIAHTSMHWDTATVIDRINGYQGEVVAEYTYDDVINKEVSE